MALTSVLGVPHTSVGLMLIPLVALLLDRSARRTAAAS